MKVQVSDRRITRCHNLKAPLRVRIWKSAIPRQRAESENVSERRISLATDSLLRLGTTAETLLKMQGENTSEATTEWLCTGHVERVEPINSLRRSVGAGVQFDCRQILRGETASRRSTWPLHFAR